ncbi:hypothetical protein AB6A40_003228 [Gnathostoma spinigerum]|uniref:Uncharacterized protein n=1 Tax=Gnathostoma spinigerum TaxID=75299 RepID=A0ABD6EGQ1_9BILA
MSVCATNPDLGFLSKKQRFRSWLMNCLFEIHPLSERQGLSPSDFSPIFPSQKSIPHEAKLASIGIQNGLLYGVRIRPRTMVRIADLKLSSKYDAEIESSEHFCAGNALLQYAFWMEIISRLKARKKLLDVVREWSSDAEESVSKKFGSEVTVADLSMTDFDVLFSLVGISISKTFSEDFKRFMEKFKTDSVAGNIAD